MPRSERMASRRERRYCEYGTTADLAAAGAGRPTPPPPAEGAAADAISGRCMAAPVPLAGLAGYGSVGGSYAGVGLECTDLTGARRRRQSSTAAPAQAAHASA